MLALYYVVITSHKDLPCCINFLSNEERVLLKVELLEIFFYNSSFSPVINVTLHHLATE